MTKKFIPTKKELELLAKVAKIEIIESIDKLLKILHFGEWVKWQPHLDMNQVAQVIKGLTKPQKRRYIHIMLNLYFGQIEANPESDFASWLAYEVHQSISVEKLLEVHG